MEFKFRAYNNNDYMKLRDFLVNSFTKFGKHINWSIERLHFSTSLARTMHGISLEEWEKKVGIWENEKGEIVAICNAEGEESGESFFQLSSLDLDPVLIEEMFDFVTENHFEKDGNRTYLHLRIPEDSELCEEIANTRDFKKLEYYESSSMLEITKPFLVKLPNGFSIRDANTITATQKGAAHAKAFGYCGTEYVKRSLIGFDLMMKTYDYKKELDLSVVNNEGEVVSFCTLWFDEKNKMGIFEPVGTHVDYTKKGLAKAVIYEAINRIREMGATRVFVLSNQQFYLSIGFKVVHKNYIWEKNY